MKCCHQNSHGEHSLESAYALPRRYFAVVDSLLSSGTPRPLRRIALELQMNPGCGQRSANAIAKSSALCDMFKLWPQISLGTPAPVLFAVTLSIAARNVLIERFAIHTAISLCPKD